MSTVSVNDRRRRALLTASLGLLAWSLGGCFPVVGSRGKYGTREITDETRVSQVREGTTTKADLIALFGKPDAVKKAASPEYGNEDVWVYYYWKFNFAADPSGAKLKIYFKPGDDVVSRVEREVGTTSRGGPAPP